MSRNQNWLQVWVSRKRRLHNSALLLLKRFELFPPLLPVYNRVDLPEKKDVVRIFERRRKEAKSESYPLSTKRKEERGKTAKSNSKQKRSLLVRYLEKQARACSMKSLLSNHNWSRFEVIKLMTRWNTEHVLDEPYRKSLKTSIVELLIPRSLPLLFQFSSTTLTTPSNWHNWTAPVIKNQPLRLSSYSRL